MDVVVRLLQEAVRRALDADRGPGPAGPTIRWLLAHDIARG